MRLFTPGFWRELVVNRKHRKMNKARKDVRN